MNSRKAARIYGIKEVTVIDEGSEFKAILTDISATGMSFKADLSLFTYKEIIIRIRIKQQDLSLKGSVRYVQDFAKGQKLNLKTIGVALIAPDKRYLDFIRELEAAD